MLGYFNGKLRGAGSAQIHLIDLRQLNQLFPDGFSQVKKATCLLEHMQDLRLRPMLLHHIDKLLSADCGGEWNAYTVYAFLVDEWLNREVVKLLKQHPFRRVPERKELFLACLRIAEHIQRDGNSSRIISEDALQRLIRENEHISWLEKFELGGRSLLNRNSDRGFRFSHLTIQEFLLARGVVHECLVGKEPLQATDQLTRFVDLADGILNHADEINFIEFDSCRYVEIYTSPCPVQDQLNSSWKKPAMVLLPGGRFQMGDIQGHGKRNERPIHEVELDSFAIGRYPVTFVEYDAFCEAAGREKPNDSRWGRGQRPVINVSWEDATDYCEWLTQETGQTYRLPTEAEWEYACRAGSESAYYFGDDERSLGEYAWYDKNSEGKTHPIGEKKANSWGLHDMHGNVWEWCQDWCGNEPERWRDYEHDAERWCGNEYYAECHKKGEVKNPQGASSGKQRVFRGGSWNVNAMRCRSAFRIWLAPSSRISYLGFRVARVQR
ncbi:MAG: formylglycine-generating enzyme family protein [Candidatus Electrothrix sp. AUS1_2]|nr:formylglycine-generating enzyme family protein [Candidatus Electrothrix sp. AUS1_2]